MLERIYHGPCDILEHGGVACIHKRWKDVEIGKDFDPDFDAAVASFLLCMEDLEGAVRKIAQVLPRAVCLVWHAGGVSLIYSPVRLQVLIFQSVADILKSTRTPFSENSMELAAIQAFIQNSEILTKAFTCFKRDCVAGFIKRDGVIDASVTESTRKPYRVQIKLDESGNPKSAFCTCLYAAEGFAKCVHIAAVLIYDYETYKSVQNPIKEQQEKGEDRVIDLKGLSTAPDDTFDFVRFLTRATGLSKEPAAGGRFALVFVIESMREHYTPAWEIRPALRYIKVNGVFFGRSSNIF